MKLNQVKNLIFFAYIAIINNRYNKGAELNEPR